MRVTRSPASPWRPPPACERRRGAAAPGAPQAPRPARAPRRGRRPRGPRPAEAWLGECRCKIRLIATRAGGTRASPPSKSRGRISSSHLRAEVRPLALLRHPSCRALRSRNERRGGFAELRDRRGLQEPRRGAGRREPHPHQSGGADRVMRDAVQAGVEVGMKNTFWKRRRARRGRCASSGKAGLYAHCDDGGTDTQQERRHQPHSAMEPRERRRKRRTG